MDPEANRKATIVEDARPFALGPRPGLLDQALSGGCVRQATDDAIVTWNWAQIGTVVWVVP